MCLGKRIKKYLEENGIKQKWLAEKIGLDEDKLSLSLNGRRKMGAEEFAKIIQALNVPAETFIKSD